MAETLEAARMDPTEGRGVGFGAQRQRWLWTGGFSLPGKGGGCGAANVARDLESKAAHSFSVV